MGYGRRATTDLAERFIERMERLLRETKGGTE
jgi:hypothetical protein